MIFLDFTNYYLVEFFLTIINCFFKSILVQKKALHFQYKLIHLCLNRNVDFLVNLLIRYIKKCQSTYFRLSSNLYCFNLSIFLFKQQYFEQSHRIFEKALDFHQNNQLIESLLLSKILSQIVKSLIILKF